MTLRFRVIHRQSGETWEVKASSADNARLAVGWSQKECKVISLIDGPFAEIQPPKIAKQIKPPQPGTSHICPDCKVSMLEEEGQGEFWWRCPSCDLLYHEWENKFYRSDEL